MNRYLEVLAIIAIVIAGLILIAVGVSFYKNVIAPEPENKAPVVKLNETNINATIGQPLILNPTIEDDGNITAVLWDQESGPESNFTQVGDDLYVTFTNNGTYIFKLEVQDNSNLITTIGVQIIVKAAEPQQEDCEPDERKIDGKCVEIPRPTCNENQYYNATDNTCREKPKPVCTVDQVYNPATNKCDPKPVPTPTPTPTPTPGVTYEKVIVTADVDEGSGGNAVYNRIKESNPSKVFILGDLGYEEDLSWVKSTYGTFGDKLFCMLGNHEDEQEDGDGSIIEDESLVYCGNSYWIKSGAHLFVVLNTNDPDLPDVAAKTVPIFSNQTIMNGVKTVNFFSHKPYQTNPNSHHPVETDVKTMFDTIKTKIPAGLKVTYTAAHNHVMASTVDGTFKLSGAGGRSHYTCGTSTTWTFCNNTVYGYLELLLGSDGSIKYKFIDQSGKVLLSK